jgi:hypothetical protein
MRLIPSSQRNVFAFYCRIGLVDIAKEFQQISEILPAIHTERFKDVHKKTFETVSIHKYLSHVNLLNKKKKIEGERSNKFFQLLDRKHGQINQKNYLSEQNR